MSGRGLVLATAPSLEPITTAEAKVHLRVTSSSEDSYIDLCVKSAREYCEKYTKRVFVTQTWNMWLDYFPKKEKASAPWWDGSKDGAISQLIETVDQIEIPIAPLLTISSISTFDDANDETVFSSSNYIVDTARVPGRVALARGALWPTDLRPINAVKIAFTAGYGATAAHVPSDIKRAIYMLMAHFFENREAMITGTISKEIELGVHVILNPYKVFSL